MENLEKLREVLHEIIVGARDKSTEDELKEFKELSLERACAALSIVRNEYIRQSYREHIGRSEAFCNKRIK